jgi:hypothetical protein
MSFSLKVQIVRALDQTTYFVDGIQWLLGRHGKQREYGADKLQDTGFQRILTLMLRKQVCHSQHSVYGTLGTVLQYSTELTLSNKMNTNYIHFFNVA